MEVKNNACNFIVQNAALRDNYSTFSRVSHAMLNVTVIHVQ